MDGIHFNRSRNEMEDASHFALFASLLKYSENIVEHSADSCCCYSTIDFLRRLEVISIDELPFLRDVINIPEAGCLIIGVRPKAAVTTDVDKIEPFDDEQKGVIGDLVHAESNLDTTGTPLECPFHPYDVTLTADVDSSSMNDVPLIRNAMPFDEACVFMSMILDFLNETVCPSSQLPVILKCDSGDPSCTLFMGFQKDPVAGLSRFRITYSGSATPRECLKTLEDIKQDHLWGLQDDVNNAEAKAVFSLLKQTDDADSVDCSSIELICNWTKVAEVLESPKADSSCSIIFNVAFGDVRSLVYKKCRELSVLEGLANGLDKDEVTWTTVGTDTNVTIAVVQLLDDLKLKYHDSGITSGFGAISRKTDVDDGDLESFTVMRPRILDFVEKLWSILKDCGGYDDLIKSFNIVLDEVKSGDIRPKISTSRSTSFSQLILDIVHHKVSAIPRLTGLTPLRLLVEMGIEKLKQDYACILLDSNLVTRDIFDLFFEHRYHRDVDHEDRFHYVGWEQDLEALRKLHCAVELVSLCQTYVNDSHALLGNYARIALNKLASTEKVELPRTFQFLITWKAAMKNQTERLSPLLWQVLFSSNHNQSSMRTAYRLSAVNDVDCSARQEKHNTSDDDFHGECFNVCMATLACDSF